MVVWYDSVSPIRAHVCLPYNVIVPHMSPSWLRHGTQVYYSTKRQCRIYAMPYSHIRGHGPT